jgi:hypothetical protein
MTNGVQAGPADGRGELTPLLQEMREGDPEVFQQRFYRLATTPAPMLPPTLTITRTATNAVTISWPLSAEGWVLEWTPSLLGNPTPWAEVSPPFQTNSTQAWITVTSPEGGFFYRLHRP